MAHTRRLDPLVAHPGRGDTVLAAANGDTAHVADVGGAGILLARPGGRHTVVAAACGPRSVPRGPGRPATLAEHHGRAFIVAGLTGGADVVVLADPGRSHVVVLADPGGTHVVVLADPGRTGVVLAYPRRRGLPRVVSGGRAPHRRRAARERPVGARRARLRSLRWRVARADDPRRWAAPGP